MRQKENLLQEASDPVEVPNQCSRQSMSQGVTALLLFQRSHSLRLCPVCTVNLISENVTFRVSVFGVDAHCEYSVHVRHRDDNDGSGEQK